MIRKDWRFSDDGDLELGTHKIDSAGNPLYIDRFGEITTDPSLGTPIRDIALHSERNVVKQILRNRLFTDAPDWFHHPEMGGNLSDLIGEPNTKATATKGEELITAAITYDGYIDSEYVYVRGVPVTTSSILFLIELGKNNDKMIHMNYPILFDLERGILTEYEIPKVVEEA